nr:integrase, catalytic region, zinc finger, CCHC-type, peptidase aspartic, catalytic [Tanacetum cinerariifolium]
DIGKLGAKGDIGFFIGYSADSCAYRVYSQRTKKIIETMNVSFDELSAMAFEQRSSKPGLNSMTYGHISSGLDLTYATSTITTQQPSEVERRNRTLVEAARTMLIFSRAPLFLWAEAIATACFTQSLSIIHRHFNKTPYELINGRKPDISFLYVFGALCYPKNDREDIGKLGAKGDIGFFIGYYADSCANRIYNRRTNVSFDELSAMAFKQRSSKPGLQSMTSRQISLGLDLTYAPSTITTQQPTKGELDLLFEAMYDDYIGGQLSATGRTVSPAQEPHVRQTSTTSTTIADTAQTLTNSSSLATNIPSTSQDVDEINSNAMVNGNTFVNPFANSSTSTAASSSSLNVDPSNMHAFYQPYPHEFQWTKDHPLEQVIGEPSSPVLTRNQLRSDAAILGFGDHQWGNILITRVYFVEGVGHNLFSVGQFCDSDLEVAFRKNAYFVRNLEGVNLLKGDRSINLYTINLHEMASASPICLMARASSTKSWLWHQRLSHLNFDTMNDLARNDLVAGLPKFKYHKEHLCPYCDQGKSKRASHPPKLSPVIIIRTDNGTEFKNQVLKEYFDTIGISHQMSYVRTPQQNGVVERRNRTLVEAARTIIYNRRTKKIMETMNVSLDELSAMAFKQRSSKPGLQSMTSRQISSGLDLTYASSTITTQQPTK